MRLDVEGPVLATALGKIPIQVVAKPLRDFGLGSHEIPDAVIFGGNANRRLYWPKEARRHSLTKFIACYAIGSASTFQPSRSKRSASTRTMRGKSTSPLCCACHYEARRRPQVAP